MSIQAPPNLASGDLAELVGAGLNDWGGVSPVTPDHVNPEAPWPEIEQLAAASERAGCHLVERLTVYPRYAREPDTWLAPELRAAVLRLSDGAGYARAGAWSAGSPQPADAQDRREIDAPALARRSPLAALAESAAAGRELDEAQVAELFEARGDDFARVCAAADARCAADRPARR